MANIKDVIMQMALKEFTKELKDPNSEVSRRFNTMLYGNQQTGEGGLFDKFTDGSMFNDESPRRTEAEIKKEMQHYKRTPLQMVSDITLPAAATVLDTVGTGVNTYKSLLGDALIAVSNGIKSPGFDNPFVMSTALGMGKKANGAIQNAIYSGVAKGIRDINSDIKNEREKEREAELLLRERPSGLFYNARRQLSK